MFIICSLRHFDQVIKDAMGRGGDGFRYPIPISIIHTHPHTQTQRVSNFCLIHISTG